MLSANIANTLSPTESWEPPRDGCDALRRPGGDASESNDEDEPSREWTLDDAFLWDPLYDWGTETRIGRPRSRSP